MKILVVSDSHGNKRYLNAAVEQAHPERIIHLGDGFADARWLREQYPNIPLVQVCGNCDGGIADAEEEKVLNIGGVRLLLCHGHTLHVRYSLLTAVYAAKEREAQAVLFGHTHKPLVEYEEGILLFNPGTVGDRNCPTYGVLTIENGTCYPQVERLEREKIQ